MASLDNYLDIRQQEREALAVVVSDADQTVDVYRRPKQTGVAGLTEEVKDQSRCAPPGSASTSTRPAAPSAAGPPWPGTRSP